MVASRFFVVALFLFPYVTEAATLYFEPTNAEIHPGDTITLAVRIDTDEGECINVVDAVVTFPSNVIPVDVSRGESILPVWVEDPVIDRERGEIMFAGGIPNGYCGRIEGDPRLTNVIVEIAFQAPGSAIGLGEQDPNATIAFADTTRVLLNDGSGSPAALRTFSSNIFVHKKPGESISDEWNTRVAADTIPPNDFSVSLERDPSIFSNQYFIVFNTTDKQTGIDHYEVIEEPLDSFNLFRWGAADAPWIEAESPYLLEDQTLNSTIRVRAIDKAGNEYVATLVPEGSLRGFTDRQLFYVALGITGGIIVLAVLVWFGMFMRRRSGESSTSDTTEMHYDDNDEDYA